MSLSLLMAQAIEWADVLWVLAALIVARRGQRAMAFAFVASCILMMRMQVELMTAINQPHGFFGLLPYHVFTRGLAVYALVYVIYFLLLRFSPGSRGSILMAASISIFFAAFLASTIVMVI